MKIIACLSVWQEMWEAAGERMLDRCLYGLREYGIDHIIAVDGRYFRGGANDEQPWPSTDTTAEWLNVYAENDWLTYLPCPPAGWPGQEVKRTAYLRAADRIAEPGDWLLQVDGDEELVANGVNHRGETLKEWLTALPPEKQTVYVGIRNVDGRGEVPPPPDGNFDVWAKLYRWSPGMYYGREHWDLHLADGTNIWGRATRPESPHAAKWVHLVFHHWRDQRPEDRKHRKGEYEAYRAQVRALYGCMNPNPTPEVQTHGTQDPGK